MSPVRRWLAAAADDGRLLAVAMQDGYVRLLDADSGAERARLTGAGHKLASLVFTADGSRLIGGRDDGGIVVWDLASGRELARLEDHSGRVYALALAADGGTLVSGSADGSVRLWDPADGRALVRLGDAGLPTGAGGGSGLAARITGSSASGGLSPLAGAAVGERWSLASSLDETLLAAGGEDGRVRFWDIAGGPAAAALLASVDTGAGQVVSLAFSGDGRRLAAGTTDGRARTFDLRPVSLLANGPAPSARAARIESTLQRLWRLAPDGIVFADEAWPRLARGEDAPAQRPDGLDLAPLLAPTPNGGDKLDQLLDRLAASAPAPAR